MKQSLLICIFLLLTLECFSQCISDVTLTPSYPSICSGNSVKLTAAATGGTAPYTYTWSTGETTQAISVNRAGTYTVTVAGGGGGCQPVKKSITLTASSTPVAPTVVKSGAVCPGSSAVLTATAPGGVYTWYDAGGNVKQQSASNSYTTDPLTSNATYLVETTLNGCTSSKTIVTISIIGKPNGVDAVVCAGSSATLSVSQGDSYQWYDSAGNPLVSTRSFTTPPLSVTTTYYVVVVQTAAPVPKHQLLQL